MAVVGIILGLQSLRAMVSCIKGGRIENLMTGIPARHLQWLAKPKSGYSCPGFGVEIIIKITYKHVVQALA